jgi:hypothetical protein
MPKGPTKAAPSFVCRRCFEPGRLRDQMLSEAYEHLLVQRRHGRMDAPRPDWRSGQRRRQASVSLPSSQGVCA